MNSIKDNIADQKLLIQNVTVSVDPAEAFSL